MKNKKMLLNITLLSVIVSMLNLNGNAANANNRVEVQWGQEYSGDLSGEYINSANGAQEGGGITNHGKTGSFNAVFKDNSVGGNGGAISNSYGDAKMGDIKGNFTNNKTTGWGNGGAIWNSGGTIGNIEADFTENSSINNGGAIVNENSAKIGQIKGDFTGNIAKDGGAIHNSNGSRIEGIEGKFRNNEGGAIYNSGWEATIGDINKTEFRNNTRKNTTDYNWNTNLKGGAIYNAGNALIGKIDGGFIENYVENSAMMDSLNNFGGGAIYSQGQAVITEIYNSIFENNHVANTASVNNGIIALGGAIYNDGGIFEKIIADLNNNYVLNAGNSQNGSIELKGGAIFNGAGGDIKELTGNFNNNYIENKGTIQNGNITLAGAAVSNLNGGKMGTVTGNYNNNKSKNIGNSENGKIDMQGGAIHMQQGNINNLYGNFTNNGIENTGDANEIEAAGGAIYNVNGGSTEIIESDFNDNYVKNTGNAKSGAINVSGGAIHMQQSTGSIKKIKGNFVNNGVESTGLAANNSGEAKGGAISNFNGGHIESIEGNFSGNYAKTASGESKGGAIYLQNAEIGELRNSSFTDNKAISSDGKLAYGGAIYLETDKLDITADNGVSLFKGNYVQSGDGEKDNQAIYVKRGTLNINAVNDGIVQFDDKIDGENKYNINLKGDKSGNININNTINNANIVQSGDVTTNISYSGNLNNSDNLTIQSGTINVDYTDLNNLNLNRVDFQGGNINFKNIDVDLEARTMGRITANEFVGGNTNIDIQGLNILTDSPDIITPVEFADEIFKDNVSTSIKEVYTALYKYGVSYSADGSYGSADKGYVVFSRSDLNPALSAPQAAQEIGGYVAMSQGFTYSFNHMNMFSSLPAAVRQAMRNENKYAITEGKTLPYLQSQIHKNAFWIKPYTAFESVPLNNERVHATSYGTLIGMDTELIQLKKGWDYVMTGYVGYNGSTQNYSGIHNDQNGGLVGATATFYKGDFSTALTVSAGANVGVSNNMFGKEDYAMLMSGIASKTNYDFEFFNGEFIVQPSLLMAYTFINTFDYTNSAGVRIEANPLHSIQLHPELKLIFNSHKGWQPYLAAGVIGNILEKSKVYANDILIPSLSVKPYVEYGAGIQKNYKDKFSAYAQAMARSGGRNGVALSFGLRWSIGRNPNFIDRL